MLLQSHEGVLDLLPALPTAWPKGSVEGLCARGGFVVGMRWGNQRLQSVSIESRNGTRCRLRSAVPLAIASQQGKELEFVTEPGGIYHLRCTAETS